MLPDVTRRPMKFRGQAWAKGLAGRAARAGLTPNAVSLCSILFSLLAAACMVASRWTGDAVAALLLLLTAPCIAMRGVCNLVDGMIAVEGGRRTKSGEVFNDFPDRVSDILIFVGAGYGAIGAAWSVPLGWLAATLAVTVAYTRMLGGATGVSQPFIGPMAKPQRMAVLGAVSVAAAVERLVAGGNWSLVAGLAIISMGCVVTIARRLRHIVAELESR
jgi:phosphatidylglycerophosphate synthase